VYFVNSERLFNFSSKRISINEVNQESMESHSDYDYKDLLKELNESEKEHKKDLRLFLDLLCKYKITSK
jgi:bacterioferritin (cytochrome b1)